MQGETIPRIASSGQKGELEVKNVQINFLALTTQLSHTYAVLSVP
jgi:hypothetical protein